MRVLVLLGAASLLACPAIISAQQDSAATESVAAELRAELERRLSPVEADLLERIGALESPRSPWTAPSTVLPLVLALLGWSVVLVQYYGTKDAADRALLIDALKYFDGGTQRRNIGISIIEAAWDNHAPARDRWRTLLVNQVLYLLTRKKNRDAPHERANLYRMMNILLREERKLSSEQRSLLGAELRAYPRSDKEGLTGIDNDQLAKWRQTFPGVAA